MNLFLLLYLLGFEFLLESLVLDFDCLHLLLTIVQLLHHHFRPLLMLRSLCFLCLCHLLLKLCILSL